MTDNQQSSTLTPSPLPLKRAEFRPALMRRVKDSLTSARPSAAALAPSCYIFSMRHFPSGPRISVTL